MGSDTGYTRVPINLSYSPSWRGFIKAEEIARLKAIRLTARRYGYLPTDFLSLKGDMQN